jgi:DNA-binding NarL/FixJ family response regulator
MNIQKHDIVIIEDNPDIRLGFQILINSTSKYLVSETFEYCENALDKIVALNPRIVLMDIDLPGMNGIEGTKRIKNLLPKTDIIIITVFENSERVFDALCVGATGYLTKNSTHTELLDALDEIIIGGSPMSANIARMVTTSFQKARTSPFSEKEKLVLQLLVVGKSYKSIASQLDLSIDTIKFHIKNIYLKLQVNNKEDAITKALNQKLV